MPELPDIAVYLEALEQRIVARRLENLRINSPFLLRTFEPPPDAARGRSVVELARVGKRIAVGLEGDLWLLVHLMIAGRLHWRETPPRLAGKHQLAAFDFDGGSLLLTEAGAKRRAGMWLVQGAANLRAHDAGGIDPIAASFEEWHAALTRENHTLKRALADPRLLSGIGNAYSDEILHRARLSPLALTHKLSREQSSRLHAATRQVIGEWIERLRQRAAGGFPERVTAFHPEMAVHGRFGKPCPACGAPVQRIRYAENETNYCPGCQTSGRVLADRSLSRLLKADWPRRLEEL